MKAISTLERFKRWGEHFLRAIIRAHQYQMCTNFMDPGLQVYGGNLFAKLVIDGGQIFLSLPMKKYSDHLPPQPIIAQNRNRPQSPPPLIQNTYYGGNVGGCFGPDCIVLTERSGWTKISNVLPTDKVYANDGSSLSFISIECIVEFQTPRSDMVFFPSHNLLITPTHPVYWCDEWVLPVDVSTTIQNQFADRVFNLLLSNPRMTLLVNGVNCVTYAHQNPEIYHSFYSTNQVRDYIRFLPGYEKGYIITTQSLNNKKK